MQCVELKIRGWKLKIIRGWRLKITGWRLEANNDEELALTRHASRPLLDLQMFRETKAFVVLISNLFTSAIMSTFLGGLPASAYAPPAPDKLPDKLPPNFEILSPLSIFPKNEEAGGNAIEPPPAPDDLWTSASRKR